MPAIACVDASVVVKWLISEDFQDEAVRLLDDARLERTELVAPHFVVAEITSAIYKRALSGTLGLTDAIQAVRLFEGGDLTLADPPGLAGRALGIAAELNQKYPYDAFYLALAEILDCDLWTADAAFHTAAALHYPRVKLLADYPLT